MGKILTDDEMNALEASAAPKKRVLTDDEMGQLEASQPLPREKAGVGEALINSVGNASGFADELTALWGATGDTIRRAPDLEGLADAADFFDTSYGGWKSAVRKNDTQIREDQPTASTVGDVTGGIMLAAVPGLSAGTTAAGRIGSAAALGAGAGAGRSDKNLTEDPAGLVRDTLVGGALGAGAQYGFDKVAGVAKKGVDKLVEKAPQVGEFLKDLAERRAFKAAVGNQAKAYDEAAEKGVINSRGRELLDEGVVRFGSSARQIADRAKAQRDEAGEAIGELLRGMDEDAANHFLATDGATDALMVSGEAMAKRLDDFAASVGGSGNKALVTRLKDAAADLRKKGMMSFADAAKEKASWQWQPGESYTKQAGRKIKSLIGNEMEEGVKRYEQSLASRTVSEPIEEVGEQFGTMLQTGSGRSVPASRPTSQPVFMEATDAGTEALQPVQRLDLYKQLKSKYGTMDAAAKDAKVLANRQEKNQTLSMGDKLAAVAGAVASGGKGLALGAANNIARKRGSSAAAVTLDKVGDMLVSAPERFGRFAPQLQQAAQRGNHALSVTHFLLMSQDPEYRKQLEATAE